MEENGFIYSSWGDPELEDMWYRMQKKAKETEEEKKRKRTEELKKDQEKANYTKIEKDFAKTLVCDGAILECPQGYFDYPVPDIHEVDDRYMPDSVTATRTEMIKFSVPDPHIFLMGVDPVGSKKDISPENFEPDPILYCKITGEPCKIKEMAQEWTNTSEKLLVNGQKALLKESKLLCANGLSKGLGPIVLEVTDNGQNSEITNAWIEKMLLNLGLTPSVRQTLKIGVTVIQIGVGVFLIYTGVGAGGGAVMIGNVLKGGFDVANGVRDIYMEITGEDIVIIASKGFISETFMDGYDKIKMICDVYDLTKGGYEITKNLYKDIPGFIKYQKAGGDFGVIIHNSSAKINNAAIDGQLSLVGAGYGYTSKRVSIKNIVSGRMTTLDYFTSKTSFDSVYSFSSGGTVFGIDTVNEKSQEHIEKFPKMTPLEIRERISELSQRYEKEPFVTDRFMFGSSLAGMFGGLSSFGASNLYDQNKQNIIDISKWAMVYGEGTSTKDVLIQADLGSGKTMELYFPKMYVYSFNQDFSIGNGEGYFVLDLKQTGFNEEGITLK